jgi:hypothetical protein
LTPELSVQVGRFGRLLGGRRHEMLAIIHAEPVGEHETVVEVVLAPLSPRWLRAIATEHHCP